jgi:hypothetical protein
VRSKTLFLPGIDFGSRPAPLAEREVLAFALQAEPPASPVVGANADPGVLYLFLVASPS